MWSCFVISIYNTVARIFVLSESLWSIHFILSHLLTFLSYQHKYQLQLSRSFLFHQSHRPAFTTDELTIQLFTHLQHLEMIFCYSYFLINMQEYPSHPWAKFFFLQKLLQDLITVRLLKHPLLHSLAGSWAMTGASTKY